MNFAENLQKLRKESGISKYKLAKEIGVNKQTISFWEEGINEPKISYLVLLADFFDVSADFLLGRTKA